MEKAEDNKVNPSNIPERDSESGSFQVYPNPVSSNLWVEYNSAGSSVIIIRDLLDNIVEEASVNKTGRVQYIISMEHLEAGVYFVTVQNDKIDEKPKAVIKL